MISYDKFKLFYICIYIIHIFLLLLINTYIYIIYTKCIYNIYIYIYIYINIYIQNAFIIYIYIYINIYRFRTTVSETVLQGGNCLIPVFALGRAQELLLILDEHWQG